MQRIAYLGSDELLYRRIQAAADGFATVLMLAPEPAELPTELTKIKPTLVLYELASEAPSELLPAYFAAISGFDATLETVVIGDARSGGAVLTAVRAGSVDFIDRDEAVAEMRVHLERRFTAINETERGQPSVFSVVLNAQPGGGGGAFALNLAIVRARKSGEALLIDCQLPVSEAGPALDIVLTYSLADAVRDAGRLDRTLLLSALAQHAPSGLRVLPLALRAASNNGLSSDTFLKAVRAIRALFSETVLNASEIREPALLAPLSQWASTVYLVCPQKFTALSDAKDLLQAMPVDFDAARRVVLIVDEFSPGITLTPEQMTATLGIERQITLPPARDELINGLNVGRPYVLARPTSPYANAIHAAAGEQVVAATVQGGGLFNSFTRRFRGAQA